MKKLFAAALVIILLFAFVPTVFAQDSSDPVDDITLDFEKLPAYFGLGAVVALLTMVLRLAGVPDGWGGKSALIIGIFAFSASKILPPDQRDTLFKGLNYLAELLLVVFGSQTFHASQKYAGLSWWKQRDTGD